MSNRKFTDKDYEEMRKMFYDDGISQAAICRKKNVSRRHLGEILAFNVGYEYEPMKKIRMPAGCIYPDMIAEAKRKLSVGCYVDVIAKDEDNYRATRRKYCRVTGMYPYIFTVQFEKNTIAFPYSDLLVRDSGVRFDRRKKT